MSVRVNRMRAFVVAKEMECGKVAVMATAAFECSSAASCPVFMPQDKRRLGAFTVISLLGDIAEDPSLVLEELCFPGNFLSPHHAQLRARSSAFCSSREEVNITSCE